MASTTQQNDELTPPYDTPFDYNEHCYEHDIDTDCLLYNDLPTQCKYYTPAQFSTNFSSVGKNQPIKLSMIHFNARSLKANLPKIKDTIQSMEYKFHIIAISETWLKENSWDGSEVNCNDVVFSGYKLYCNSRKNKHGGGVAIYVCESVLNNCQSSDICLRNISYAVDDCFESIFIEIQISKHEKINVGCMYRAPNTSISKFNDNLSFILGNLTSKIVYICGDYNIDLLHCEEQAESKYFIDQMFSSGLYPLITRPTRVTSTTASIIDNIFCSELCRNKMCGIVLSDATDHMPIFVLCDNSTYAVINDDPTYKYNRTLDEDSLNKFKHDLNYANWDTVMNESNPDLAFSRFMQILNNTYNDACPVKTTTYSGETKKNDKPWLSRGLKNACIKKNNMYLAFLKNRTELTEIRYKNYKNKLTKLLRLEKKKYYRKKLDDCKTNIRATWKTLNSIIGKRKSDTTYLNKFHVGDNIVVLENKEIANHFNNFFVDIGTKLSNLIEPCPGTKPTDFVKRTVSQSMYMSPVTEQEVLEIVSGCKSKTSYGHDEISMKTVKHVIKQIVQPLIHIFNRSLISGSFPNDMKLAKVIPIFKSGDRFQFSNYRPISLLSQFSKILEKIFNKRLRSFIETQHILTDGQYGFRSNHSTSLALTEFVEKITSAMDKCQSTIGVFIDLKKAFDTVDHNILLSKLQCYGIRGLALAWIKSYLTNRRQYVCYNNSNSEQKEIKCGVPQGSILGPLLFILYINDMCEVSKLLDIILFADDTNIFYSASNTAEVSTVINNELKKLDLWFRANKLSLNVNKTHFIMFNNKKQPRTGVNIVLNGKNIEQVSYTKFLGVTIDENVTWREHIKMVESKVSKNIAVLYKTRHVLDCQALHTLYNSLVEPHMSYCCEIWGNTYQSRLRKLFMLQKKAIRIIYNLNYHDHTSVFFHLSNMLKFHDLVKYKTMIILYKANNHSLNGRVQALFEPTAAIHIHDTRQSKLFYVKKTNTTLRLLSITVKGIKTWNNLPNKLTQLPSLTQFKKAIKLSLLSTYL